MANRNVLINEDSLIDVADAIRGVTGSSAGLRVADMPSAISAYGAAASSDITALGGQIDAILENHGEKNLLVLSAKTTTANGITYTVNLDGSIHVSGTASGYSSLNVGTFTGVNGQTYILTGCPQGGDSRTYVLGIDGTNYSDTGDGVSFTSDGTPKTIYIGVLSQTIDTTFYPMVRDSRIISSSYVKYNGDVDAVFEHYGQKNVLHNMAETTTINGITFTMQNNGSVIANGTASGGNATLVMYKGSFEGYEGYLFTGCPSGGGGSTYFMAIEESGGNYQIFGRDNGEGGVLSGQGSTVCNAYIRINNGTTVSNLVFKPMLRDARIVSDEYVPYNNPSENLCNSMYRFIRITQAGTYRLTSIAGYAPLVLEGIHNSTWQLLLFATSGTSFITVYTATANKAPSISKISNTVWDITIASGSDCIIRGLIRDFRQI